MNAVTKVYDIMKSLKKRVRISNFSRDTFFLNMGCEIIAAIFDLSVVVRNALKAKNRAKE